MIKKMVFQHQQFSKPVSTVKTIIFDIKGVLLMNRTVDQIISNPNSTCPMVAVNFLETLALLKACKAVGHKLFILSNMSVEKYEKIKQEPEIASLFSFFDDIIISDMTPYKKPNPEIFTYLCQQYNLKTTDCVFIDDQQDNLDGAQKASIYKTILCSNFDLQHVRNELVSYGILQQATAFELNIPTGQA